MVKCDEVLVRQGGVVKVGIGVHVVKRWLPLLVNGHYDVPQARQTVDIDDDYEDEFEQFQGVLHILRHVHAFNNAAQA